MWQGTEIDSDIAIKFSLNRQATWDPPPPVKGPFMIKFIGGHEDYQNIRFLFRQYPNIAVLSLD